MCHHPGQLQHGVQREARRFGPDPDLTALSASPAGSTEVTNTPDISWAQGIQIWPLVIAASWSFTLGYF